MLASATINNRESRTHAETSHCYSGDTQNPDGRDSSLAQCGGKAVIVEALDNVARHPACTFRIESLSTRCGDRCFVSTTTVFFNVSTHSEMVGQGGGAV